jgi:GMP synthase-like glutamine amidotransferase
LRITQSSFAKSQILILQADGLIDQTHGYGHPIKQRLDEFGISSEIVPIAERTEILPELPEKPLILSGGMTEVTADIDWINDLKAFVEKIIESNQQNPERAQPLLGICFGAQIIAEAFHPGSVSFLEDPEFGVSRIVLEKEKHKLFDGFDSEFDAYSFHYNQIWCKDVRILSKHKHRGHEFLQAFEIPDAKSFGVQFHPEFRHAQMSSLFKAHQQLILEFGFDLNPIIKSLPVVEGNDTLLKNFTTYFSNLKMNKII